MLRWIFRVVLALFAATFAFHLLAHLYERDTAAEVLPAQGRLVPTEMGAIYVEEAGPADGPAVLLLHGSIGWAGLWRPTLAALAAEGYHAYAFDMPPMGFSERDPVRGYARQTQADRVVALAKALAIRPILVAHSFGAGAASEAAMRQPEAFAALVVVSGALGVGTDGTGTQLSVVMRPHVVREAIVALSVTNPLLTRAMVRPFVHRKEAVTPAVADLLREPMRIVGTTSAVADWAPTLLLPPAGARSTTLDGWRALALPTAFVWGERDTTTPLEIAEDLVGQVRGATLTVLPDVGHIPMIEDEAGFVAALVAALAQVSGGG